VPFFQQLKVTTDKGFHLGGVVENIRIQGIQDPATKRWECEDYIIVSSITRLMFYDKISKLNLD